MKNRLFQAVEAALRRLDLLKYAHKRVNSLSGGNKRKLCTALCVMAPVPVVLMDEPTRYFLQWFINGTLLAKMEFMLPMARPFSFLFISFSAQWHGSSNERLGSHNDKTHDQKSELRHSDVAQRDRMREPVQ